jgi:hypothetical protein
VRQFYSTQLEQDLTQIDVPSDFDAEVVGAAMIKDLEKMLAPLGTRENPAISCLDISLCHGDQFTAGHYWIDPNEGSPKDAIRVFCKGPETCLTPRKQSNSQFVYPEGIVPLRLLRLRHSHVRQNITYTCDSGANGFMEMKLQGVNGGTLSYGDKTIRMVSLPGECPVVLEVTQEDSSNRESSVAILPVRGISVDSDQRAEAFNAGPVCFS